MQQVKSISIIISFLVLCAQHGISGAIRPRVPVRPSTPAAGTKKRTAAAATRTGEPASSAVEMQRVSDPVENMRMMVGAKLKGCKTLSDEAVKEFSSGKLVQIVDVLGRELAEKLFVQLDMSAQQARSARVALENQITRLKDDIEKLKQEIPRARERMQQVANDKVVAALRESIVTFNQQIVGIGAKPGKLDTMANALRTNASRFASFVGSEKISDEQASKTFNTTILPPFENQRNDCLDMIYQLQVVIDVLMAFNIERLNDFARAVARQISGLVDWLNGLEIKMSKTRAQLESWREQLNSRLSGDDSLDAWIEKQESELSTANEYVLLGLLKDLESRLTALPPDQKQRTEKIRVAMSLLDDQIRSPKFLLSANLQGFSIIFDQIKNQKKQELNKAVSDLTVAMR